MPRYYFHIYSRDEEYPDRTGEPLEDDAQAIAMAHRIVSEIAEEPEHRDIEVRVVGRKGRAVATVDTNGENSDEARLHPENLPTGAFRHLKQSANGGSIKRLK